MAASPRRSCRSRPAPRTTGLDGRSLLPFARTRGSVPPARCCSRATPARGAPVRNPRNQAPLGRGGAGGGCRQARRRQPRTGAGRDQVGDEHRQGPGLPLDSNRPLEYTVYANGQTELYDMKRDPGQLHSLALDSRYRFVRKWLYNALIPLSSCAGAPAGWSWPRPGAAVEERAAAEGEQEEKQKKADHREEHMSPRRSCPPVPRLRLPHPQGHWPNWLRHRPPKSAIPGSSPGCPAVPPATI